MNWTGGSALGTNRAGFFWFGEVTQGYRLRVG